MCQEGSSTPVVPPPAAAPRKAQLLVAAPGTAKFVKIRFWYLMHWTKSPVDLAAPGGWPDDWGWLQLDYSDPMHSLDTQTYAREVYCRRGTGLSGNRRLGCNREAY